jgi:tripartite-type tricarboxylate transporter receptor subunit TctC
MTALLGGQVQLYFAAISTAIPHVRSGKLRALAVSSARRSAAAPEYPTIAEAGVPGYEHQSWVGTLAPAGTPPPVVATLNGEAVKVLQMQEVKTLLLRDGLEVVGSSPKEFGALVRAEIKKWAQVVKASGITAQ